MTLNQVETRTDGPRAADTGLPIYPSDASVIAQCIGTYLTSLAPSGGLRRWAQARYLPPTAAQEVAKLLEQPARSALRGHVRDIGWRLFVRGGTAAMTRVCDRVAHRSNGSRVAAILDRWWSGIGDDRDIWIS